MYPYNMIDPQAFVNEQMMLQNRINQLEQQRNQQLGTWDQNQAQPAIQTSNVNWIQVAGIEGARNQIVQPGQTMWMMDNNNPIFYVKSVDGMGSATFKAFQFTEILPEASKPVQNEPSINSADYVTRAEFNALLERLGDNQVKKEESE